MSQRHNDAIQDPGFLQSTGDGQPAGGDTVAIPAPHGGTLPVRHLQLDFIDGMRALAALYIVVHHVLLTNKEIVGPVPFSMRFFRHGQEVVAVFLTISGFCLALPQAQRSQWKLDHWRFLRRRAMRILPPYYAAVGCAILAGLVQMHFGHPFRMRSLWLHSILVQNWSSTDMYTLDGPLWSVALECQVYLLFPLIVLLRARSGPLVTLLTSVAIGYLSFRLLQGRGQTIFLAYFALGVFFAETAFQQAWRRWLPWIAIASALGAVFWTGWRFYISQALWTLTAGALMAYLTHAHTNAIRRVLSWKPLVEVGLFSYSIYLVHSLFTETTHVYMHAQDASFGDVNDLRRVTIMGGAALLSLVFAYFFHRMFELPFMSKRRQAVESRVVQEMKVAA